MCVKKTLNIIIEDYTFGVAIDKCRKAIVYFNHNQCETNAVKLPFINGFEETEFLCRTFGPIQHWYKANDKWKGCQIQIAWVDQRPMALINKETEEICLFKSPIFTKEADFYIYKGNLVYLSQEYGVLEEEFIERIRQSLQEKEEKIFRKKR